MTEIDFKGKTVFVSSPYSTPDAELKALRYKTSCISCGAIMRMGGYPLSPVVHGVPIVNVMTVPDDYEYWKEYCLALVSKCDFMIILMVEGWEESSGVKGEMEAARKLDIPVYFFQPDIENKTLTFFCHLAYFQ